MSKPNDGTDAPNGAAAGAPITLAPIHLQRCPFCGANAVFHECDWCEPPEWSVHCADFKGCGAMISGGTRERVGELWNRREYAAPVAQRAAREAGVGPERAD